MCISGWEPEQGLLHGPWSVMEMEEEESLNCFWKKEFLEVGWVSVPDERLLRLPQYYIKSADKKLLRTLHAQAPWAWWWQWGEFQIFGLLTGDLAYDVHRRVGYGCSSLPGLPWPSSADSVASLAEVHFLTVLDAGSPRSRGRQGCFSWGLSPEL